MVKSNLIERLYDALSHSFDEEAIQVNISINLQMMMATIPDMPAIGASRIPELIADHITGDSFLPFWLDAFAEGLTEAELEQLVTYFESEEYKVIGQLLSKVEPVINQAMLAYATAVSEAVVDDLMPGGLPPGEN